MMPGGDVFLFFWTLQDVWQFFPSVNEFSFNQHCRHCSPDTLIVTSDLFLYDFSL